MTLAENDYQFIWHPYTHQKDRLPAIPIAKGKGAVLYDEAGNGYIDAISSWWVNIHGHGNKYIAKKLYGQAKKLEQVIFTTFTHEPAVLLAEQLLKILPGNFVKIFYSDNGSTATEVAIKMALQYWVNMGNEKRNKIMAFQHAYHGDTFGAMSVSERGTFTLAFRDKLFEVIFIDTPHENNIDQLASTIQQYHDEIACFIYEPLLQGAGGMKMHGPQHLDTLLGIMKSENIICIADEVLTGFYRTGKFFASDYLQAKADIICLSKALTGGTMALGVTAGTQKIYDAFVSDDKTKTLFHGHSFTANPLACTAALASLELIQKKECITKIENIVESHKKFLRKLKAFEKKGIITNLRQTGTICAFDINTGRYDYLHNTGPAFTQYCLRRGVYIRPLGNTIYIMTPYCITPKQLRQIYAAITDFIKDELMKHQ
ncbi:MAG TPA: adenosylmethionine--8-amino-7-oxononanoate transaminase [Chitinophagaceae bacterium]|nr:adenosylmethionine--8-amino-7-oxononanoate transaminase [Chitinophagaceae bacterium]